MKHTPRTWLFLTASILPGTLQARQAPPAVDIFLATLHEARGIIRVGEPLNLTDRDGYDNQPQFSPDGRLILYTSLRDGQADIYRYDVRSGSITPVTVTPESEYSATFMPGGASISVIQVEADTTQRLWEFGLDGSKRGVVLADIAPVGYHAWGTDHLVALFVLGSPPTLQLADRRSGRAETIAERIGRSIHRMPGHRAISFVEKVADDDWWIKKLNLDTREVDTLVRTRSGAEDYAWTPHGTVIMGQGPTLYAWRSGSEAWVTVADFSGQIDNITRLAVSPLGDYVAIVANRAQ